GKRGTRSRTARHYGPSPARDPVRRGAARFLKRRGHQAVVRTAAWCPPCRAARVCVPPGGHRGGSGGLGAVGGGLPGLGARAEAVLVRDRFISLANRPPIGSFTIDSVTAITVAATRTRAAPACRKRAVRRDAGIRSRNDKSSQGR